MQKVGAFFAATTYCIILIIGRNSYLCGYEYPLCSLLLTSNNKMLPCFHASRTRPAFVMCTALLTRLIHLLLIFIMATQSDSLIRTNSRLANNSRVETLTLHYGCQSRQLIISPAWIRMCLKFMRQGGVLTVLLKDVARRGGQIIINLNIRTWWPSDLDLTQARCSLLIAQVVIFKV